jgi:dipeptidyl aminopeptidase/acylaminoacyl peptidase
LAQKTRRAPRPDDLYRLQIPTDPRLSPDGRWVTFTVQRVGPTYDKYRTSIWIASADPDGTGKDGSAPRQLTIGARSDNHLRWAPDGRTIGFLSDRRTTVEEEPTAPKERDDANQVHLLPIDRPGEARRLTDLPRGVDTFEWSPDGTRLAVLSSSRAADRAADGKARRRLDEAKPGTPPASDYRFFDRLGYQLNGAGFIDTRKPQVWIVDVATGEARRLTSFAHGVDEIVWAPDGKRLAITTSQRRDADLSFIRRILVLDVDSGRQTAVADRPDGIYFAPSWLPDGERIVTFGGRRPAVHFQTSVLVFAADGSEARSGGRNLTTADDVMAAAAMGSDLTPGENGRVIPIDDGRALLFMGAHEGSMEIWRVAVDGGGHAERLTDGHHYLSNFDAVGVGARTRVAAIRSMVSQVSRVVVGDLARSGKALELRDVANLNTAFEAEVELREPLMRWVESDGRRVQSWLVPARDGDGRKPTVIEIHGGPHTLYGWSPYLEFQILAGAGMSVLYTNPRGSDGYGREFNEANINDWGDGPMRDVMACIDAWIEAGRIDPDRLGVTGGSYGGYLTNWIVGHTDRFKAAFAARSVSDIAVMFQVGDLTGTDWPSWEVGPYPWENPTRHRELSPITYADNIRTPLLLQHSERDIRTTVAQAEMLFARLRRLRRPVRFMRVPEETHELTRSGTPFRRVENLVQVRDWFAHFLVAGKRRLPPLPRTRHGI